MGLQTATSWNKIQSNQITSVFDFKINNQIKYHLHCLISFIMIWNSLFFKNPLLKSSKTWKKRSTSSWETSLLMTFCSWFVKPCFVSMACLSWLSSRSMASTYFSKFFRIGWCCCWLRLSRETHLEWKLKDFQKLRVSCFLSKMGRIWNHW